MVHALIYYLGPKITRPGFGVDMLTLVVSSLQISAPILYILWRSGRPLAAFGFLRPRWFLDAGAGVLVFFAAWMVNNIGWRLAYSIFGSMLLEGTSRDAVFHVPRSAGALLVFFIAMAANAFAEELAMRGYLITRLRQLGASPVLALVISAGLFGSYHIYQGLWASILVTLFGVVFALAFLWLGRLWPLVVGHFLLDLLAVLQNPS
jgi:membrane protease YdiL (CAAX protease family)